MSVYSRFRHDPASRVRLRRCGKVLAVAACLLMHAAAVSKTPCSTTQRYAPVLVGVAASLTVASSFAPNDVSVHQGEYPRKTWRDFPADKFDTSFRFEKARPEAAVARRCCVQSVLTRGRALRAAGRHRRPDPRPPPAVHKVLDRPGERQASAFAKRARRRGRRILQEAARRLAAPGPWLARSRDAIGVSTCRRPRDPAYLTVWGGDSPRFIARLALLIGTNR